MVKKLIKYEFKGFARLLLPVELCLLGIAALTRFIQIFEADTAAYNIAFYSSSIILGIAVLTCIILTAVMSILRFYKNLFSKEGYLSFTLPVTPSQHIRSKLAVSLIFDVISTVTILISLMIATAGDVCGELFKAAGYIIRKFTEKFGANGIVNVFEVVLLIFVATVCVHLLFYACISIGQLANKSKGLAAFGVFFGYYMLKQALGTVIIIFSVVFEDEVQKLIELIEKHPKPSFHIIVISVIAFEVVLSFVYALISKAVMKKKLNLV